MRHPRGSWLIKLALPGPRLLPHQCNMHWHVLRSVKRPIDGVIG